MKINDRYEIQLVVIENCKGMTGDCYTSFQEFRRDYPDAEFSFGYILFDTQTGFAAEDTEDWYDTPEEALAACPV
jgi:hypothetical protein